MPQNIDNKQEQIGEVKRILTVVCHVAGCPPDNKSLNELSDWLVRVCRQSETDPVYMTRKFAEHIASPGDNIGALMSRRVFFHKATGGKFTGG